MSKSILVIDNGFLNDVLHTLKENELYCEARTFEDAITSNDTTELLEALESIKVITKNKDEIKAYYKLYKALGGVIE